MVILVPSAVRSKKVSPLVDGPEILLKANFVGGSYSMISAFCSSFRPRKLRTSVTLVPTPTGLSGVCRTSDTPACHWGGIPVITHVRKDFLDRTLDDDAA